jgi:hypothetical protein
MSELPLSCSCECEHRGFGQWGISTGPKTKESGREEEGRSGRREGNEKHNAMQVVDDEQTGEKEFEKVPRLEKCQPHSGRNNA